MVFERLLTLFAALLVAGAAAAQFDPTKMQPDPEAIARQFPDPEARFDTPGFAPGRSDFPTHAEVFAFVEKLAARSPRVEIETIGHSQEGRAIALLVLTGKRGYDAALPTVLIIGQQHGNEPAGGEASLVLAERLAVERPELLDRVNVLIVPRANPDGAEHFVRVTRNGADMNRDHLLARTPEAQALVAAATRYSPQVILDLHEFTVGRRWITKFDARMRYDALLQAASTGNLSPIVVETQARYVGVARQALERAGLRAADYYTTNAGAREKTVYMGGVNVDTGRNVGGLRNAVSILLETRGVDLGREHFARRVNTHALAATAIVENAAAEGSALVRMTRDAGARTASLACHGDMVVATRQTPTTRTLSFLDAQTGEPRNIDVDWRSSFELETLTGRSRPCGYLIDAAETRAVRLLRELGVTVNVVVSGRSSWQVERYVVDDSGAAKRQDGRGAIDDADEQGIVALRVHTDRARIVPPPGSFYVPLNQPLAGLISAALEPDSQNSFAANRIIDIEGGRLLRVVQPPTIVTKASAHSAKLQ